MTAHHGGGHHAPLLPAEEEAGGSGWDYYGRGREPRPRETRIVRRGPSGLATVLGVLLALAGLVVLALVALAIVKADSVPHTNVTYIAQPATGSTTIILPITTTTTATQTITQPPVTAPAPQSSTSYVQQPTPEAQPTTSAPVLSASLQVYAACNQLQPGWTKVESDDSAQTFTCIVPCPTGGVFEYTYPDSQACATVQGDNWTWNGSVCVPSGSLLPCEPQPGRPNLGPWLGLSLVLWDNISFSD